MSAPAYNGLFRYNSGIRYADTPQKERKTTMARIALNLKNISARDLLARVLVVHTKLTGNADVPDPNPTLVDMKAHHDAALAAVELVEKLEKDLQTARANRDALMDTVMEDFEQQASTVESATRGEKAKITGCGFDTANGPSAVQPVAKIENNVVTTGDDAGTADGGWNASANAKSYEVQICPDPMTEASWKHYVTVTTSQVKITGQPSGARIWTRVRGINRLGPGPWSDPACAMIP